MRRHQTNNSSIRGFIKDNLLHKILDEIEIWMGLPVQFKCFPEEMSASTKAAVTYDGGHLTLYVPQKSKPSQITICHELVHMCLYVEGWPRFAWWIDDKNEEWLYTFATIIVDLVQHVVVWPLVSQLGYSDDRAFTLDIKDYFIPHIQSRLFFIQYNRQKRCKTLAILLAHALLSPADKKIKADLRKLVTEEMPEALEFADDIIQDFESAKPFTPQSCVNALFQVFEKIETDKELLCITYPDRIFPEFRQRILSLLHDRLLT
jgi:hypothetical protein